MTEVENQLNRINRAFATMPFGSLANLKFQDYGQGGSGRVTQLTLKDIADNLEKLETAIKNSMGDIQDKLQDYEQLKTEVDGAARLLARISPTFPRATA